MPRATSPVFVGRTDELDRITRAFGIARRDGPVVCLIGGEAGIGKSRFIAELATVAARRGARVAIGHCVQVGETGLPYGPLIGALRDATGELTPEDATELLGPGRDELLRLLPHLSPGRAPRAARPPDPAGGSEQARLFELLLGLIRRLTADRPLVLGLEDLHWADAATRDFIRFFVRNARGTPVLLVGSYRSDELHRRHPLVALLAELGRLARVDRVELGGLAAADVAQLVRALADTRPSDALVRRIHERSGGNPFFVEELMAAGAAVEALPSGLRQLIDDRIARRSPATQQLLRAAAVGGAGVDGRVLGAVAGLDPPALADALEEAVEHHLLVPPRPDAGSSYAFRHALLREAIYDELLPHDRSRLHAAYAAAIEAMPEIVAADPAGADAQVAEHWLQAADLPRALGAAIRAARSAAATYAFAQAQLFWERALELWGRVPDAPAAGIERRDLLAAAGEAAAQAGDPRRAIDLTRAALAEFDPVTDPVPTGVLFHRLAWHLSEAGDWEAGANALERAVGLIPIDPPTPERARVVSDLAHSLMVRGRFGDSIPMAEAALAISRATGERQAESRALTALGLDFACRNDFGRGVAILQEGYALARQLDDPHTLFLAAVGLGWAYDETGRHAEAHDTALAARRRMEELGAIERFGALLSSKAARALTDLGRWDEAAAVLDETLDAAPSRYAQRWLLSNRIRLGVLRGRLAAVHADLDRYAALGERVLGPDPDLLGARRVELAIVEGRPDEARRAAEVALGRYAEPETDTDARLLALIGLRAAAAEALVGRGTLGIDRQDEVARAADRFRAVVDGQLERVRGTVRAIAHVLEADEALAAALHASAHRAPAVDAWRTALELRRPLGRPWEIAETLVGLGTELVLANRAPEAEPHLREALEIARRLGGRPLQVRIEALARRGGLDLAGAETLDDALDRFGLTPREREVLTLVADGRSNREIATRLGISESTAGVHVSNLLGKLGVARRTEAAALAHRLGLLGQP